MTLSGTIEDSLSTAYKCWMHTLSACFVYGFCAKIPSPKPRADPLPFSKKEWDGADLFTQHTEASPEETFLEVLKAEDQLPTLAHELLTSIAGLDLEHNSKFSRLFLLCLAREPTDRSTDFVELLQLLSQARGEVTPCIPRSWNNTSERYRV